MNAMNEVWKREFLYDRLKAKRPKSTVSLKTRSTNLLFWLKSKSAKLEYRARNASFVANRGEVDLFHIIGVGDKKHATNPDNLLLSCRFCHLVWGANDDFEKILKFNNFDDIMNRLKTLDSGKYWKFRHKIEKHVIKKYFYTKDKTDLDRLGIKFVSPL